MIKLINVSKSYGEFKAVNNLNLDLEPGEIVGIIGGNGAGKTTTFRMILGITSPSEGEIVWKDEELKKNKERFLGYLPEERGLIAKIKVKEQLLYLARLRGMGKEEALENIDFWLEKFKISDLKNKKVSELSKGNQQKIQFIYSVVHNPKVLILDEPFSGLDPLNTEMLKEAIKFMKNKGTTILFSSHRMENIEELCEKIFVYKKGNIVDQGYITDLKNKFIDRRIVIESNSELKMKKFTSIKEIVKTNVGFNLELNDDSEVDEIMKNIVLENKISKIEIQKPSLTEIFINLVGDSNE